MLFLDRQSYSVSERSRILLKIADIIDANKEFLAAVETMDNGKPIRETLNVDVPYAAEHFRYFAGVIQGEEGSANVLEEKHLSLILREPIGVVAQIVPWNFPFLMAAWKLAPVIAAGDTSVLKPSSETSLSVLELMRLIKDVLPKGVVNVITGKGSGAGAFLQKHSGIDKIAFTGSTEIGREIAISAAEKIIPATLELGGKSANIIYADAAACFADVARPVQAQGVCADFRHAFQPQPAAFGKHDNGNASAFAFAFQSGNDLADVFEAEFFKRRVAQDAAPSVENLHSLRARVDLGVEVGSNGLGVGVEDFVQ